jgi:YidC/Oxa1 family membrane protein insertase
MFPLVIKAQRNAAKMTNNMPQLQVLQQKLTDARQAGNAMEGILLFTQVPSFFFLYLEF